jgi:hypothetical protein
MTRYDGVSVSNVWDSLGNRLGVLHKPAGASGVVFRLGLRVEYGRTDVERVERRSPFGVDV